MTMRKRVLAFVALTSGCALLSCGPTNDLSLRESKAPGFEQLRRRQAVRYIELTTGEVRNVDPADIISDVDKECRLGETYLADPLNPYCPGTSACTAAHCLAYRHICTAQLLMEMAGIVSEPVVLETIQWEVPAQSTATNAALQRLAMDEARMAVETATTELHMAGGLGGAGTCTDAELTDPAGTSDESLGRSLSMAIVEAFELAKEAGTSAANNELALADAYFSEHATSRTAATMAFSAPLQSRASAVHLLVGGEDGLYDALLGASSQSTALCTAPPLSSRARAAIDVYRESGVQPSALANEETFQSTEAILVDTNFDSVRKRLTELWNETEWSSDTASQFADRFGLAVDDFREARDYLRQEIQAFDRSLDQLAPPLSLPEVDSPHLTVTRQW